MAPRSKLCEAEAEQIISGTASVSGVAALGTPDISVYKKIKYFFEVWLSLVALSLTAAGGR